MQACWLSDASVLKGHLDLFSGDLNKVDSGLPGRDRQVEARRRGFGNGTFLFISFCCCLIKDYIENPF